jgi:protein-tyrosine phosphatase
MDGQRGGNLPRGGNAGFIEFSFDDDGWTIFLSSANGAADFEADLVPIFNVTLRNYFGDEHEMDLATARRLKILVEEMQEHRNMRRAIVVHCNHGRTRSVITIGVYLMMKYRLSAAEALNVLKSNFASAVQEVGVIFRARNVVPHFHSVGERVERALTAFEHFRDVN